MKNTKMPAIRFKGFNDDWEQRKLGDVLDDMYNGQTPSRNKSEYWNGNIKWLSSGELNRGTVYDSIEMITENGQKSANLRIVPKGTFIMSITGLEAAGTRGNCALLGFDTTLNQSCMALFPKKDLLTSDFLFQWYRKVGEEYGLNYTQGTKQQSYNAELIKILPISLPLVAEQKKIASYLRNLDNLITLHQRKLEKIKLMKKSMLGKMFSRDAESIPKIRFDGYTDDWEQRKLGDVIEKLTGGASIAPDDYVDVGYRTIPKGAVNSSGVADMSGCKNVSENFFKKNISSKTSSGELVTSLRDLVPTAPNMGRIVRICGETEDFLMPQGVYSIIVKEKISEDFLITYSNSPEYRKIIMAEKNGSTQVHIRNGEFLNIDIPLPSYEEQMKIGEHFKTLNHLITLHQRKLEKLKKVKKSLLEHMFPMEK